MAALRVELLPLKEDGRLQSCRLGGLDAWMPGCLEAWRLAGLLAYWLVILDWIGFEWLLDRRKWWDWRIITCSHTLDAQRGRRIRAQFFTCSGFSLNSKYWITQMDPISNISK